MIYKVELDGDIYDHAEFRQMIEEYGADIIEERPE